MDIDKIISIGERNGFEVEVFLSKSEDVEIELDGDNFDNVSYDSFFGIGVRVIKNGKVGFAYSNKLDNNLIYEAMNNLVPDEHVQFSQVAKYPSVEGLFSSDLLDLSEDIIMEDLIGMMDILKESNITITGGGISKSYEYVRIINTNGVDIEEEFTTYSGSIGGIKNGETAYEYGVKRDYFDITEIGNKVVELISLSENSKKIDFKGNIVLSPETLKSLLGYTLIPSFNAENVQRNRSVLCNKLGEMVFNNCITIHDDGIIDEGIGSSISDGEGTPSQKTTLVKNGILKNYLYDIKRGNIDGKKSTGNGGRSYNSLPSITTSNIIIEPYEKLDNVDKYLYVNRIIGSHTSNPISGDFSVEISNGYIVKNGDVIPIKRGMLSGNIFSIFKEAIPLDNVEVRGSFISPPVMFNGKIIV